MNAIKEKAATDQGATTVTQRILVVDDESSISELIATSLRFVGFEVRTAANGSEALVAAEEFKPHAIVLDVMMPMVDGFATLEQIKKEERLRHCKVIFLSAKNKEKDIEKGLSLGADLYVIKPFSVKKLVEQANELIQ